MGARSASEPPPAEAATCFESGDVRADTRHGVAGRGEGVWPVAVGALGPTKHRLLCYLLERPGVIVSRGELLVRALGYNRTISSRTVDVHVAGLRRALKRGPDCPLRLLSVYGRGYKLVLDSGPTKGPVCHELEPERPRPEHPTRPDAVKHGTPTSPSQSTGRGVTKSAGSRL